MSQPDNRTTSFVRPRPEPDGLGPILGRSDPMKALFEEILQAGPSAAPVLIVGETGTGKELVARTLHQLSPRRSRAFVAVNCAAIPETLVESELFGHEKGAFTGAASRSAGYFEQASRGTLFLDEISTMPSAQQAKLLRALQDGRVRRLGGSDELEVDVRIIAAMNLEPERAIEEGKLRLDLFYRLSVFTLRVPPLRDRLGDLPLLARHFAREQGGDDIRIDPAATRVLHKHRWPGNVRELRNALEHAAIIARDSYITADDLPATVASSPSSEEPVPVPDAEQSPKGVVLRPGMTLEEAKRRLIVSTLEATRHNVTEASRRLGISPRTVYNKIREWNLPHPSTSETSRLAS